MISYIYIYYITVWIYRARYPWYINLSLYIKQHILESVTLCVCMFVPCCILFDFFFVISLKYYNQFFIPSFYLFLFIYYYFFVCVLSCLRPVILSWKCGGPYKGRLSETCRRVPSSLISPSSWARAPPGCWAELHLERW